MRGNTVGSYENKYWQKKLIDMKRSLTLNNAQKDLLVGTLLGDGTLRLGKRAVNANCKIEQGLNQQDYVWWKYKILAPWVLTPPKVSFRYTESGDKYPKSLWFRTVRHPEITVFHKLFYPKKKKIVPKTISQLLSPLAMAVWVMDDGCFAKKTAIIDVSAYSFTLEEVKLLQGAIKKCFGIIARKYRDRQKGYRIYFNKTESAKVVDLIKPHVIESMSYKIGFRNPVTTGSHVSHT